MLGKCGKYYSTMEHMGYRWSMKEMLSGILPKELCTLTLEGSIGTRGVHREAKDLLRVSQPHVSNAKAPVTQLAHLKDHPWTIVTCSHFGTPSWGHLMPFDGPILSNAGQYLAVNEQNLLKTGNRHMLWTWVVQGFSHLKQPLVLWTPSAYLARRQFVWLVASPFSHGIPMIPCSTIPWYSQQLAIIHILFIQPMKSPFFMVGHNLMQLNPSE
jgi:hypothetical protein